MSLYLDNKYLMLISNRLPLFKRKSDTLFNCRCIICGDSTKNNRKARGYFFNYKNELRYKCHNCDASVKFSTFLKNLDSNLFSQYTLEKFEETNVKPASNIISYVFEQPSFTKKEENLIDQLLDRLDILPPDNEAVLYCKERKIPENKFSKLYYIDNIKKIVQLNEKYKQSIRGEESRLVIPFYDNEGQLSAVTCRAIHGEALRYITVKVKEDAPLIFGLENIDKSKTVYVVEGPLDSLFLNNCIAVGGTSFGKITHLGIDKSNLVLIYDNQPRNIEVCKLIEKNIDQGYNVVIWPQTIQPKDINNMVHAGIDVKTVISKNIYSGLTAKAKFLAWRRC